MGKVANRVGGVNSWQERALNAIKPWVKQPRDVKTAGRNVYGSARRRTAPVAIAQPFAYIIIGSVS